LSRLTPSRPTPSRLAKFAKSPKGTVLLVLLVLTLIAALRPADHAGLLTATVSIVTAVVIDVGVALICGRRAGLPDGAMITGLLVADVLSHTTPLYIVAATTAVALLSKHVLKVGRKPVFNPAALGLLVAIFVFNTDQSWWGSLALLPTWMILIVMVAGVWIAIRVNKFPQVAAFLGTYFVLLLAMALTHVGLPTNTPADALRVPFVNTALFLAFFMLTDPPTSPSGYGHQVVFGMLAALVGTAVFAAVGGLAYLLIGLLVANAWQSIRSVVTKRRTRQDPRSSESMRSRTVQP